MDSPNIITKMLFHYRNTNARIHTLCKRTVVVWFVALALWINDHLLCDFFVLIGMPFLHALWHIGICIVSYACVVVFSYYHAVLEVPHLKPTLMYWPIALHDFGVPYIYMQAAGEKATSTKRRHAA